MVDINIRNILVISVIAMVVIVAAKFAVSKWDIPVVGSLVKSV